MNQTKLNSTGPNWAEMNQTKLNSTGPNWAEMNQTKLNKTGQSWTKLSPTEQNRTKQILTEQHWTELSRSEPSLTKLNRTKPKQVSQWCRCYNSATALCKCNAYQNLIPKSWAFVAALRCASLGIRNEIKAKGAGNGPGLLYTEDLLATVQEQVGTNFIIFIGRATYLHKTCSHWKIHGFWK